MWEMPPNATRPYVEQRQFTLRQLFAFVVGISVVLTAGRWLWLGVEAARASVERSMAGDACFKAVFALHCLDEAQGHLPCAVQRQDDADPDSEALCSWRALTQKVLGYETALDLSSRWDSPSNAAVRNWTVNNIYCRTRNGQKTGQTSFVAITGPGTAFGDGTNLPLTLREIPGDTILIVETRKSGLQWMEPGDFDIRTMPRTINAPDGSGVSGANDDGFLVGFADGRCWWLSNDTPFDTLATFFTIKGAEANDRDELLAAYNLK